MKSISVESVTVAALVLAALPSGTQAGGISVPGVVSVGSGSNGGLSVSLGSGGNGTTNASVLGGVVSVDSGSGGVSVGLLGGSGGSGGSSGGTGGSGGTGNNGSSGGTGGNIISVPGVAEVGINTTTPGVSVDLLGGGGGGVSVNTGGILPGTGGVDINLPGTDGNPDVGGLPTGPGLPGLPGVPGTGVPGTGGTGGGVPKTRIALPGGGTVVTAGMPLIRSTSARFNLLQQVMHDRDWMRLAAGRAVCLGKFGTAEVQGWLPKRDHVKLKQVIAGFSGEIESLQTMLGRCGKNDQREALGNNLNRVIGVDVRPDGMPVLFLL